jgi:ferric-dicitrate binding protein FerR (iron transport regulator)
MKEKLQLAKWIDEQLSKDEEKNIPDLELYRKIKIYSADMQAPALNKNKVKQKINSAKKANVSSPMYLKFAATLVLLLGIGSVLFVLGKVSVHGQDSVSYVYLPDQSKVHLQNNSSLDYNRYFWFLNREVELSGNAFFEVEKGEKFTVNTTHGTVEVLGTKFTVETDADNLKVMCFEGKVAVYFDNQKEVLLPNKSIKINLEQKQVMPSEFNYNQPIWAFDNVKFDAISFEELIAIVSDKFSIRVDYSALRNPSAFTGTLQLDNLEESLSVIASTYSVHINQINKNNYIFVEHEME